MRKSILVADDEESNRIIICELFDRCGYVVDKASDGLEALELLFSHTYSLGIFDIMMPGMTGIELLEEMKLHGITIPVVITTSIRTEEIKRKAISKGAAGFFYKPIELEPLRICVRNLIGEQTSLSRPISTSITLRRR